MALLKQMPQISLTKTVTNYSGDIQFMLFAVCLRNNAACCIPLRNLRNLRENNTQEDSINLQTKKPQYLSQITLIHADINDQSNNMRFQYFINQSPIIECFHIRFLQFIELSI